MLKKSSKGRLTWDYIRNRHSEVIEELKTLRNWDGVKSAIPESETIGDYSLLALEAISAVIRELRIERSFLSERIENLSRKIEELGTSHRELSYSVDKRLRELEGRISELEQRTLFLEGVEAIVPRMNELEEKLDYLPAELFKRIEETYGKKADEHLRKLVEKRVEELREELKREVFGISVDLTKALRELQGHYEELVEENVRLRSLAKENEKLRKKLMERERELEELKKRLAVFQEMTKRVDALSEKIGKYEEKLKEIRTIEKELLSLTGARDALSAIEVIKSEFIPKSKFEKTLAEIKSLLAEAESLKDENERLKRENEKLKEALKTLLQERLEEESSLKHDES
ncbi:hypothetical protein [Thermococcus sp.]|uniref:hypothetical protein n=1 Tax=Thermococcus sp. TaxID=35749 RepID=UPI0025E9C930|nr:hypothetical protein [Thermococcus sp.]